MAYYLIKVTDIREKVRTGVRFSHYEDLDGYYAHICSLAVHKLGTTLKALEIVRLEDDSQIVKDHLVKLNAWYSNQEWKQKRRY